MPSIIIYYLYVQSTRSIQYFCAVTAFRFLRCVLIRKSFMGGRLDHDVCSILGRIHNHGIGSINSIYSDVDFFWRVTLLLARKRDR